MARCTLSVSCSTDLDNCVVFVGRVGVFFEHVHRTLKASERFTSNFSIVSLYIACLLSLVASTTTAAAFTLKSDSITGQPASELVVMTRLPGSSRTLVLVFVEGECKA